MVQEHLYMVQECVRMVLVGVLTVLGDPENPAVSRVTS